MKLSKLVKKARLLRCETFSRIINAIIAKNWLKKISDTFIDMELDDSLKLKVATRLLDKSAVTWRDNFKKENGEKKRKEKRKEKKFFS